MKPQTVPLYATDETGAVHLVIGWGETYGGQTRPIVVPYTRDPGKPGMVDRPMSYSFTDPTERWTMPDPAEATDGLDVADTAVLGVADTAVLGVTAIRVALAGDGR